MDRAHESLANGLGIGGTQLLRLALGALARRDYGRNELERKLRRVRQDPERAADLSQVLDRLQAKGLLSDGRMAQGFVRTRAMRYGRLHIEQELQRRGLDRSTITAALPLPEDEFAVALALWRRKFGRAPATTRERARQGRYLASRGFAPELVARILRGSVDSGS
ncbi:MAG TPA: regulatory protein RecX [Burkholderiaceae bacterium]|nr:regulatory protein RecX [Burkholderiaceae bacterium]